MLEEEEALEIQVENGGDDDDVDEDDDDDQSPVPPITNREMEQACRRLEDRLCVLQMYSQIPNKLANTYCVLCRRFLRLKSHNCPGVVDHDFIKKFGGVSLLSQEFITKCLDKLKEIRDHYRAAVEHDIFWELDKPADYEVHSGIGELCKKIDQRDLTDTLPEPVEMPLNISVYDSWASRLDFEKYERAYPLLDDGQMWICFVCFRLHEDKADKCPFENCRSIEDYADEQVHLKLDARISGHKICTEEVRKAFYDYTVEKLTFYRRLRRQDYLLNKEKYNSSVDDTDEDLFLPTDEDEKTWRAEQKRQKKKTKRVKKTSSKSESPDQLKKPRYDDDPSLTH